VLALTSVLALPAGLAALALTRPPGFSTMRLFLVVTLFVL
jgi:hypothetical protein